MARVPYEGVPTTNPAGPQGGYENIEASPSSFGALQGAATQRLGAAGEEAGSALGAQAVDWQQRYNQIATQDGYNKLEKAYLGLTYGDPNDPTKKGIYAMQGAEAMRAYPTTMAAMEDTRKSIMAGIPTDAARLQFDEASRRLQYYTQTTIGRHVDEQTKNWGFQTETDAAQNAFARAAVNPGDPQALQEGAEAARDHMIKATQNKLGPNLDPATVERMVRQADTGTVMSTIDGYLRANNPAGAKAFLDNGMLPPRRGFNDPPGGIPVKSAIDPQQHEQLLEKVQNRGEQSEGQDAGARAFYGVTGGAPNPAVVSTIKTSAAAAGIPQDQALTIAHIESRTGTVPDRPGSQYKGVYQMGDKERASVGLDGGADQVEQADKGVKFVANAYKTASEAVGHPAAGWQTYMVHQQGAGAGPALLKADPTASAVDVLSQAGSKDPVAAISQNGGQPGMTVGQFLNLWQVKYNQAATSIGASTSVPTTNNARMPLTGDQIMAGEADLDRQSFSTPQARSAAQSTYTHHIQLYNEAVKADSEKAVSDLVGRIHLDPGGVDPVNDIMNNPHLTGPQKDSLWALQLNETGTDDVRKYGPGYTKAYKGITADESDPNKITDLNDILKQGAPGGDLTTAGVNRLTQIYTASRKSLDEYGIQKTAAALSDKAKRHLSFQSDDGIIKLKDPVGEDIYEGQFVPMFEQGLAEAKQKGPAVVRAFLSDKNLMEMVNPLRDQRQMARDKLAASGQTGPEDVEKPDAPIPAPPSPDLNTTAWYSLMSAPPTSERGAPFTHAAWAEVLKRLTADPDKVGPWFDKHFGPGGYKSDEIVQRLKKPNATIVPPLESPAAPGTL